MKLGDVDGLVDAVSQAIHLGEWCPVREKCRSKRSASSDAAAKAALETVGKLIEASGSDLDQVATWIHDYLADL